VSLLFSAMLLLVAAFGSLAVTVAGGFLGPMVVAFCALLAFQGLRARDPRPQASQTRSATANVAPRRGLLPVSRSRLDGPRSTRGTSVPASALARPFSARRNIHQPS